MIPGFHSFYRRLVTLLSNVDWMWRQRRAHMLLADYDAGLRCIACDGMDTVVEGDRVECRICTYVSSLSTLRRSKVDDEEIAQLTYRPSYRP